MHDCRKSIQRKAFCCGSKLEATWYSGLPARIFEPPKTERFLLGENIKGAAQDNPKGKIASSDTCARRQAAH